MAIDIKIFKYNNGKGLGIGHLTHVFEGKKRPMCIANVRFVSNAEPQIILAMPPGAISPADLAAVSRCLAEFHAAIDQAQAEIVGRQATATAR